jgi:hypothetical protein
MPPVRKAGRKDSTQAAIVSALRAIGCEVLVMNQEGVPDLLTHYRGGWIPIEVKNSPRGHLTPLQADLRRRAWFPVVSSVDEALALFGVQG